MKINKTFAFALGLTFASLNVLQAFNPVYLLRSDDYASLKNNAECYYDELSAEAKSMYDYLVKNAPFLRCEAAELTALLSIMISRAAELMEKPLVHGAAVYSVASILVALSNNKIPLMKEFVEGTMLNALRVGAGVCFTFKGIAILYDGVAFYLAPNSGGPESTLQK